MTVPFVPKPGDLYKQNTRERALSEHMTMAAAMAKFDIGVATWPNAIFTENDNHNGFVLEGMQVSAKNPASMYVNIYSGIFLVWEVLQTSLFDSPADFQESHHGKRLASSESGQIQIEANSSGNPRIDVICASFIETDDEEITVDIFNETTEEFDPTANTPKVLRAKCSVDNGGIFIIKGTPGASPVEPDCSANPTAVKLAAIYVASGATSITNSVIFDRRVPMKRAKVKALCDNAGNFVVANFYGSSKTIYSVEGGLSYPHPVSGIIESRPSIVKHSKPSTGVYRYTLMGFKTLGGNPVVNAVAIVNGSTVGVATTDLQSSDPQLIVRTYDMAGTPTDLPFSLQVEAIEF